MKIFFHSCGSIKQYIPDLIEVGFDILNPVQTNCYEMDPEDLKREFGKDITFWGGGVDTASVINRAYTGGCQEGCIKTVARFFQKMEDLYLHLFIIFCRRFFPRI